MNAAHLYSRAWGQGGRGAGGKKLHAGHTEGHMGTLARGQGGGQPFPPRRALHTWCTLLCILAVLPHSAHAHLPGDITYYAFQWPEGFEPEIDGDLAEWEIVPSAYVQTTEDLFQIYGQSSGGYDLSDFSARLIVGWNAAHNLIYLAAEVFDDLHEASRDMSLIDPRPEEDAWEIMLDADHSGGRYNLFPGEDRYVSAEERRQFVGSLATQYIVSSPAPGEVRLLSINASTWSERPPVARTGSLIRGNPEGESTTSYEVALVPFDELVWTGSGKSRLHRLEEEEIVGIECAFTDSDDRWDERDAYWSLAGSYYAWLYAQEFSDFLLAPVEDLFTGTKDVTWGRIKSTFRRR